MVDAVTWRLERSDGAGLTLIRGRQCATAEGLEVLVVGTASHLPDGLPLLEIVDGWIDRPVLVMLPWGFGKWTGRRGRLVSEAYATFAPRGLRLADTAARPAWIPTPRRLRRAAEEGHLVATGSDPFPFPDRVGTVGRYGFVGPSVDVDARWPDMLDAIHRMEPAWAERFGRPMDTLEFISSQTRIQLQKRIGREV